MPRWRTSYEPQPIEVTPEAVYFLSHCSRGEERDALLLKAGELGSLDAQRDLGAYFATGNWTGPKDPVLAIQWYRRAAERGQSDAQYNLGFMYVLGEGIQSDPEEGLRWLRLAPLQAALWDRRYHECEAAKNLP
ncbi:MAG TPA: tetratricopeptide repeat protein [Bryobacteraceae bacterium]|nr:tetratricopeptide repeat protein [Bryobacteraceae bacterium]